MNRYQQKVQERVSSIFQAGEEPTSEQIDEAHHWAGQQAGMEEALAIAKAVGLKAEPCLMPDGEQGLKFSRA